MREADTLSLLATKSTCMTIVFTLETREVAVATSQSLKVTLKCIKATNIGETCVSAFSLMDFFVYNARNTSET